MTKLHCPLCAGPDTAPFHTDRRRHYLRCADCALVFVPPRYYLDRAAERAEYDLHENAVDDPGYRRFLSRLFDPLAARLRPGAEGLDFGCGPGPALAAMLREAGFAVNLYDLFYHPDAAALARDYDFICATEVVEHLHHPGRELERLWRCLRPGGVLGIMTKLVRDREAFAGWHYKNDPTHVCFFSRETWRWWARRRGASLVFEGADVILVTRPR
ncbi:class I SAM-dependent methyltransferase [Parahaliea mediterranea]|uniref:Class I SAM-dependent methyltransferase n=2 Tax=Parahaliea mediterranea TaxID=651086 RepID=A0A939INM2_9GAMM|nr:class I SAM-dependent methyltransferase [Parahaliea mediterranea]MBN7798273.1 class I SAM-dependent methyltransferase [Parahaliea mediterranea]